MKNLVIGILVVMVIAGGVYLYLQGRQAPGGVACTLEAKLCPDGSSVGRTGPNCEFALCPEVASSNANIRVDTPKPNDEIGLPMTMSGVAREFESSFAYRLLNAEGKKLIEGYGTAQATDAGQFGPFTIIANYPDPQTAAGTLEVFAFSAKDGAEIDKVTVPVRFAKVEATTVKVFFSNSKKDPKALHCEVTYPVDRRIAKTPLVATEAIHELLRGTTGLEDDLGYLTSFNTGVELQSLTIADGVAKADFNRALVAGVGGSCRVQALRSQIENTLKQFPTVKSVVISVDGTTMGVLEP